jgi:hypothetical protein
MLAIMLAMRRKRSGGLAGRKGMGREDPHNFHNRLMPLFITTLPSGGGSTMLDK